MLLAHRRVNVRVGEALTKEQKSDAFSTNEESAIVEYVRRVGGSAEVRMGSLTQELDA